MPVGLALLLLTSLVQPPRLPSFRSDSELSAFLHTRMAERTRVQNCNGFVTQSTDSALTAPDDSVALVGGRVRDVDGHAASSAQVLIGGLPGGTVTRDDGSFRLLVPYSRLRSGDSLTLTTRRLGYQELRYRFALRPGRSLALRVSLCRATLELEAVTVQAAPASADYVSRDRTSITNTQHAGVDEGDIVKQHGDQLVILRRGRLFSVSLGDDRLSPLAAVNAFGPDIDPRGTWYDELLVSGDQLVVIGYSYQRGGTEVGLFHIDSRGKITHRATYQLRSYDYYSSRNYASRLIGSTLVFYSPLYLPDNIENPLVALPSLRRYRQGSGEGNFQRIATVQRVYRPAREWSPAEGVALHTVTTCQLGDGEMTCQSTVVIGPPQRSFYVSPSAVYVWTSTIPRASDSTTGTLFRMPLDGSAPSAVGVNGQPEDQFSFLESYGYVNVLVRSAALGVSLLRLPLRDFGDGGQAVPFWRYRPLPDAGDGNFQNRFVGDYVLYGAGNVVTAVPWQGGDLTQVALDHRTERIEVMGREAIVIGASGDSLRFTGIHLAGSGPRAVERLTIPNAAQGELRSHGFFYREDGVIGLPIRQGSPGVLFVRNNGERFTQLGVLAAGASRSMDDACRASCVDWYGNARPLFVADRVFALLGYELVEGAISGSAIEEVRRVSFAPRGTTVAKD
jgi:hypothetical protein